MKIIKATEPILITQIKAAIFAPPGVGKTSFALTAEAPLLLDFDKGHHRAINRADSLEIDSWSNVVELLNSKEELTDYKTLVLDTGGKALDLLGAFIIAENGKLANSGGALTLQGYGVRKSYFKMFLDRAAMLGLDIVIVCHDKEEKVDDTMKVRPDLGGSSYSDVMKEIDLCGYMEIVKGKRTIDFNPSERAIGKNCAGFDQMDIEKITMAQLIREAKATLNSRNIGNAEILSEVEGLRAQIEAIDNIKKANGFVVNLKNIESDIVKQQVRKIFTEKTISLGLIFDGKAGQNTGVYIAKADFKPAAVAAPVQ